MRFFRSPLGILLIVLVIVFGFVYRDGLSDLFTKDNPDLSPYQAVFLTNGQVYFGKAVNKGGDYLTLEDVFYLQANKQLQPQTDEAKASSSQLSLIKLGSELHGPDDVMHINRDQILFFEDLKRDGRVFQAISEYRNSQTAIPPILDPKK